MPTTPMCQEQCTFDDDEVGLRVEPGVQGAE